MTSVTETLQLLLCIAIGCNGSQGEDAAENKETPMVTVVTIPLQLYDRLRNENRTRNDDVSMKCQPEFQHSSI